MKQVKTVRELAHFMEINDTDLSREWVDNRTLTLSESVGIFEPQMNFSLSGFNLSNGKLTLEFFPNHDFHLEPVIKLGSLRQVLTSENCLDFTIEAQILDENGNMTIEDELVELDKGHSSNSWYLEFNSTY